MSAKVSKAKIRNALKLFEDWSNEIEELETNEWGNSLFEDHKLWISETLEEVKSLVSGSGNSVSAVEENGVAFDEEEEIPVLLPKTPVAKKMKKNHLKKRPVETRAQTTQKETNEDSSTNENNEVKPTGIGFKVLPSKEMKQKSSTSTKPILEVSNEEKPILEVSNEEKTIPDLHQKNGNNEPNKRDSKSSVTLSKQKVSLVQEDFKNAEIDCVNEDAIKSEEVNTSENLSTGNESVSVTKDLINDTYTELSEQKSSANDEASSMKELPVEFAKSPSAGSTFISKEETGEKIPNHSLKLDCSTESFNCQSEDSPMCGETLSKESNNCDSTFVVTSNFTIEKETSNILLDSNQSSSSLAQSKCKSHSTRSLNKMSSKVDDGDSLNFEDLTKENVAPSSNIEVSSLRSLKKGTNLEEIDLEKTKSATNHVENDKRKSTRRSSLCQYKSLVNKAIRTSISAEQKKIQSNENREDAKFNPERDSKHSTPMNQTRKMLRTLSATTSSGMKKSVLPRTHSLLRHHSPLPIKMTSTISNSSRSFLSSKSVSRHITRTGNGPSNIVRDMTTFLPVKPSKPTADELKIKTDQEALRKRQKEDEAIRRKEELAKLKIEEKKALREARLKKVMENKRILERQLSSTDLRKPEIIKTKISKDDVRERQEAEKERARLREIQGMKQQKDQISMTELKRLESKEIVRNEIKTQEAKETFTGFEKPKPILNVTITKDETATTSSYDMTLAPEERPPKPLRDENNYDVADLKSDDGTDDEDQPKKAIPKWASGTSFRQAIVSQTYHPPDIDDIFDVPPMPDLSLMFPLKKNRFFKRTSSAVWNKAPISHSYY